MIASQEPHHENERVISTVIEGLEFQLLEQPDKGPQGCNVKVKLLLWVYRLQKSARAPIIALRTAYCWGILEPTHYHFENRLSVVRIFANANLGQTVQGGIAKRTELHTDGSAGGIIKPRQEISERSEHTHQVHGHELLDRVNMFDE